MKKVFLSHPYASNPRLNTWKNRMIIIKLQEQYPDCLFISPLLLFGLTEETPIIRRDIMQVCYHLIDICDEVWIFGDSKGCRQEKKYAKKKDKKIVSFTGC